MCLCVVGCVDGSDVPPCSSFVTVVFVLSCTWGLVVIISLLLLLLCLLQLAKARDIASLEAKGTDHALSRAAALRETLASLEQQAETARADSATARGEVLKLRAEREKHLLDAVGNAKAAAEAAVALELSRIKAMEAATRLRAARAIAEKVRLGSGCCMCTSLGGSCLSASGCWVESRVVPSMHVLPSMLVLASPPVLAPLVSAPLVLAWALV